MKLTLIFLNILITIAILLVVLPAPVHAKAGNVIIAQAAPGTEEFEKELDLKGFIKAFYIYLSRIIIILSVLMGIIGAYMYMTSGGSPDSVKKAKDIIYSALIGIIAVAFAYLFFEVFNIGVLG